MAVIRDNIVITQQFNSAASPVTISGTINDNTNGILLVWIEKPTDGITGITWDGVALTKSVSFNYNAGRYMYCWSLIAPHVGTKNLVISHSSINFDICAVSYIGVKQSGFPDASATSTTTGTTATGSVSITTVANGAGIAGFMAIGTGGSISSNSNTVAVTEDFVGRGVGSFEASPLVKTTAGSLAMSITFSGSQTYYGNIAMSMAPAVISATASFLLKMI